MAKRVADLAVKIGSYTKADGTVKNKYENIGSKFENDNGGSFFTLKRTFNPAGVPNPDNKDSIIISVFDIKEETAAPAQKIVNPEDIAWNE